MVIGLFLQNRKFYVSLQNKYRWRVQKNGRRQAVTYPTLVQRVQQRPADSWQYKAIYYADDRAVVAQGTEFTKVEEADGRPWRAGNLLPEKPPKAGPQQVSDLRLPPEKHRSTSATYDLSCSGTMKFGYNEEERSEASPEQCYFIIPSWWDVLFLNLILYLWWYRINHCLH